MFITKWWRSGVKVIAWSIMTVCLIGFGIVVFSSFVDKPRLFDLGVILASPIISMMVMTLFEYLTQKIEKQNRGKLDEVNREFAKFQQHWWRSDVSSEELVVSTLVAMILMLSVLTCVVLGIIPEAISTLVRTAWENNPLSMLLFTSLLTFGVEVSMAHIIVGLINKKD